MPPEELFGGIGPGDFWRLGFETAKAISHACDLNQASQVVELGSGLGRVALPLCSRLPRTAQYRGYDVASAYVAWCKRVLAPAIHADFLHLDLANSQYNPGGTRPAHRARIPEKSGAVDLVLATSLLTHLVPREIERYLTESARMLRSQGTFFCTLFLLDETTIPLIEAQKTYPTFTKKVRHGYLANADSPGEAVAVDRDWFFAKARKSGLLEVDTQPGGWRGTEAYYQDIVVLERT